jgi:transcriptional regulator with XRE-family HTH domain
MNEAEVAERNERIWKLRLEHKSQREIGRIVGIDQSQVSRILNEMAAARTNEKIDDYLKVQLERLDLLAERFLALAMAEHLAHNNGRIVMNPETGTPILDDGPSIAAYAKYLDVLKEKSKLLGLYAPEKRQVESTVTITPPEILNLINDIEERDNG